MYVAKLYVCGKISQSCQFLVGPKRPSLDISSGDAGNSHVNFTC